MIWRKNSAYNFGTDREKTSMDSRSTRRTVLLSAGTAIAASAVGATPSLAQAGATPLKVVSFPGLSNLSIYAAQSQGLFAKHQLAVELAYTPNSQAQRDGLAKGETQIIHTAADNAVAMVELAKQDAIIVAGGDNGFNRILAQPDVKTLADLRGKTVVVDAPNTAFALLLYKALQEAGLKKGDYKVHAVGGTPQRINAMLTDKANAAAGVIGIPMSFKATAEGLKDMGSATKGVGAYQSGCIVVMRPWAKANSDVLVRYLKAIVGGYRWLLDPANKSAAIALMKDRLKLSEDDAAKTYAVVTDPADGFAKDGKFDLDGFKNVLKLRAEIEGQWGGTPPAPDKYIDLSYYNKAVAGL
jgi:ABC-type nitrate/sulfonate/bicarbonate transport system substrate-binding protein